MNWISALVLIDTLDCILSLKVTNTQFIEIFFFNQRQVRVPFHLCHWLFMRAKFIGRPDHNLALVYSARQMAKIHLTLDSSKRMYLLLVCVRP